jgi:predicted short-subunit dehydrogenase-like oxidoreductase (DUF2520 family)
MTTLPRIAFVGAGRVGATLAPAMHRAGFDVVSVFSRDADKAASIVDAVPGASVAATLQTAIDMSDLVFLTVGDDAIDPVCAAASWRGGQAAVHCSGATDLGALRHARETGASVAAFHPMQMFANPAVALATLRGCTVTIEADAPLFATLEDVAQRIGCRPVRLPPGTDRALYHASINYVGPFLIALMQESVQMWRTFGLDEPDVLAALVPLLQGTVAAVQDAGLAGGMGGCVARGDVGTVRRHLAALERFSPEAARLYRELTRRTIPLALARGTLRPEGAQLIAEAIDGR